MRGERFKGMLFSEFESERMKKLYPFCEVDFDGGGGIVVKTGNYVRNCDMGHSEIVIQTGLNLDESQYDVDGEERIAYIQHV